MLGIFVNQIVGESMMPLIKPGSFVIAIRPGSLLMSWLFKPKQNDMVIVQHPQFGRMIKTVSSIDSLDGLWLQGESRQSITSTDIGRVTLDQIVGKVLFSVQPQGKGSIQV